MRVCYFVSAYGHWFKSNGNYSNRKLMLSKQRAIRLAKKLALIYGSAEIAKSKRNRNGLGWSQEIVHKQWGA